MRHSWVCYQCFKSHNIFTSSVKVIHKYMYNDNRPQTSSPDEDSLYSVENIAIHIPKKNKKKKTKEQQNKTNNYTLIQCTQGWPVLWCSSLALKVYPYSWTWLLISTSYDLALQRPYIYLLYLSQRMDVWNIVKKNPYVILSTLKSIHTFSVLFSIHFLRCWQGEFV